MFHFDPLSAILGVIQQLIPQIEVTGINDLKLQLTEEMKLAEAININLHFKAGDDPKPTAIITPRKREADDTVQEHSIVLLSKESHQPDMLNLTAQDVPFGSGSHLIINQPSWWESQETIRLRRLRIDPLRPNQSKTIEVLEESPARRFHVYLDGGDHVTIQIWEGMDEWDLDFTQSSTIYTQSAQGSAWTIEKYLPTQIITFDTLQEIVLSFDPKIIRETILIKRERELYHPEYYVLVISL